MQNQRYYPQEAPPFRGLARIEPPKTTNTVNPPNALEPHYSLKQIAEAWGISVRSVRSIFRDQPGVADIAVRHSLTSRSYQVLRIPASVVARVHAERANGFTLGKRKGK